ncbi:hypothetical protein BKA63DRAFT_146719 [Paraphoma chrysanthemicola]|nr:hypothetical protein BKA63DRAFT_146719 [Paraphoma chrysanthemicola]
MWDFEIFDKATRGPWGAFMLLYRTKGRSLAALGAILIVLLLAIDTFFQQVVTMPTRWMLESKASMLPLTIQYEPSLPMVFIEGVQIMADDKDIFHMLEKFAYGNGTEPIPFGNGTRPEIPVSCPTSNCTWPPYDTLGMCSRCQDISSYLTFACIESRVDWTSDLKGGFGNEASFSNATTCGYFLNATSGSPVLMSGYVADPMSATNGEALMVRILPLTDPLLKEPLYGNGSIHFKQYRNTLTDVLIVSASDGTAASVYRNATPIAQECMMSWCVQRMQSSYHSGEYEDKILDTYINTTAGPWPWVATIFGDEEGNGTDVSFLQEIEVNVSPVHDQTLSTVFGTRNRTHSAIVAGFSDIFPSSYTAVNGTAPPLLRYKTWSSNFAWNRQLDFNPWLAPNNVSRHMDRWASAMTNVIRSAPSKRMLEGSSFSRETFISVEWAWLSFPMALLLFSLVFLISTLVKTSQDGEIGTWKTSAMPTLIYGLPHDIQKQFVTSQSSRDTFRKGSDNVNIKLLPDRGWRVSRRICVSPTLNAHTQFGGQT